jgi:hypothetical protein
MPAGSSMLVYHRHILAVNIGCMLYIAMQVQLPHCYIHLHTTSLVPQQLMLQATYGWGRGGRFRGGGGGGELKVGGWSGG